MKKVIAENKKLVKTLQTEVERLQKDLVQAKAREGKDPFLTVKVRKSNHCLYLRNLLYEVYKI